MKSRHVVAAMGLGSFAFGLSLGVAHAGSAYSAYDYFSTAGRQVSNQSGIHTNHDASHSAHASTYIGHLNGNLPAGYIGSQPVRRDASGALQCQGTYSYSGGTAAAMSSVGCFINNHSTYSSKGATRTWDGSGYVSRWTLLSPNQNS